MLKELIGTAVKVKTEREAKLVLALYELAGFRVNCWGHSSIKNAVGNYIICTDKGQICYGPINNDKYKLITLYQLVWGYGISPNWANHLVLSALGTYVWLEHQEEGKPTTVCFFNENPRVSTDQHSWHINQPVSSRGPKKGSIPPVGTECEAICSSDSNPEWFKIQYLGEREGRPIFFDIELKEASWPDSPLDDFEFRPIKTEREKVIDACVTSIECLGYYSESTREVLEFAYDIGALRMPEDE